MNKATFCRESQTLVWRKIKTQRITFLVHLLKLQYSVNEITLSRCCVFFLNALKSYTLVSILRLNTLNVHYIAYFFYFFHEEKRTEKPFNPHSVPITDTALDDWQIRDVVWNHRPLKKWYYDLHFQKTNRCHFWAKNYSTFHMATFASTKLNHSKLVSFQSNNVVYRQICLHLIVQKRQREAYPQFKADRVDRVFWSHNQKNRKIERKMK